jgi:hypothetical protein
MLTKHSNLEKISEDDILREFHKALVSLHPILIKLECLENDSQSYDDFEEIAESLWNVLVCKSLMWKYSLDKIPDLGRYDFDEDGKDGYIEITDNTNGPRMRFIGFLGCKQFGNSPFNGISCVGQTGLLKTIEFDQHKIFRWKRNNEL